MAKKRKDALTRGGEPATNHRPEAADGLGCPKCKLHYPTTHCDCDRDLLISVKALAPGEVPTRLAVARRRRLSPIKFEVRY